MKALEWTKKERVSCRDTWKQAMENNEKGRGLAMLYQRQREKE